MTLPRREWFLAASLQVILLYYTFGYYYWGVWVHHSFMFIITGWLVGVCSTPHHIGADPSTHYIIRGHTSIACWGNPSNYHADIYDIIIHDMLWLIWARGHFLLFIFILFMILLLSLRFLMTSFTPYYPCLHVLHLVPHDVFSLVFLMTIMTFHDISYLIISRLYTLQLSS